MAASPLLLLGESYLSFARMPKRSQAAKPNKKQNQRNCTPAKGERRAQTHKSYIVDYKPEEDSNYLMYGYDNNFNGVGYESIFTL